MSFQSRAPRETKQREYTDVQFVYGENWTWQIPSYFNLGEIAKIRQVPFTHAHNWLIVELNKALPVETSDRPPSQIVKKTAEQEAGELLLATLKNQQSKTKIIPSDDLIDTVINRFDKNIGANQWSDSVCKDQLDLICLPKDGAPSLSSVFDRADKELMQEALRFFYSNPSSLPNPEEEPSLPKSDSGNGKKNSGKVVRDGL